MAEQKKPADDYEVGYRKPPKQGQFKKGQSGNPKGRPKRTKNFKTDLLEEFGEPILIREGNRSVKISKQRALLKSQMARGLKGNDRAAAKMFDLLTRLLGYGDEEESSAPPTEDEQAVIDEYKARVLREASVKPKHRKRVKKPLPLSPAPNSGPSCATVSQHSSTAPYKPSRLPPCSCQTGISKPSPGISNNVTPAT